MQFRQARSARRQGRRQTEVRIPMLADSTPSAWILARVPRSVSADRMPGRQALRLWPWQDGNEREWFGHLDSFRNETATCPVVGRGCHICRIIHRQRAVASSPSLSHQAVTAACSLGQPHCAQGRMLSHFLGRPCLNNRHCRVISTAVLTGEGRNVQDRCWSRP
jgi:hypothetical protein